MCAEVERAIATVTGLTAELGALGLAGDVGRMMMHSADDLDLFSTVTVGWQWLVQATAAREALARGVAQHWIATELPKIAHLAVLCRSAEDSYARMRPEWL